MKVTEEMVVKAEKLLATVPQLVVLADEDLTTMFMACRLYRMERAEPIVDESSTKKGGAMNAEQEFEMLVNVLVAHKRVLAAVGWAEGDRKFLAELNTACTALLRVKEMCSEENQRLAEMSVA